MKLHAAMVVRVLMLAGATSAPALAVSNPVVVDLHAAKGTQREASATLFGSGASVLVNVTAQAGVPKTAAVTLNAGDCTNPGGVAFALSGISDKQSMTQLSHPLTDIAGKAKSLVIHQTADENSPAYACGKLSE